MEFTELQNMWQQYDKKVSENIRLNKEILKKMVISKTEKRLTRIKLESGIRLIIPLLLLPLLLLHKFQFTNTLGLYLFIGLFILAYFFRIKHYLMAAKINFSNPVSLIKKEIIELKKYQLKMSQLALLILPIGVMSIFLLTKIPFLTQETLVPLALMFIILAVSYFYKTKYSYGERFRKLNQEIEEIEQLEK
jgi:hypothetical protein